MIAAERPAAGEGQDEVDRCVREASCEPGDHTRSWPCEYAPGTGSLADVREVAERIVAALGAAADGGGR